MAVDTTVQVTLPQMGESVTEGTVLEWHKQEGDRVEADETLVEISTDKVDAEIPAPVGGVLVRTHAAEGETVTAGSVIAEIQPDGAGPAQPDADADGEPQAADDGAATGGAILDIVTPTGGESVSEATVLEWSVKVGDHVDDGQTLVELSTDKVDMELPAPAAGTITELLADEGDTVTPHQVIARMRAGTNGAVAHDGAQPAERSGRPATDSTTATASADSAKASPVAQRVAAAEGVDLSAVHGSGPGGRITKTDVLDAKAQRPTAPANGSGNGAALATAVAQGAQPLKGGAATLARYMDESRSIPTATSFRTLTVTVMDGRRKQLKDAGHRVSFTHLIAYAIARA